MLFAGIEDGPVIEGQHIIHQRRVGRRHRLARTLLENPELQAAGGDFRTERARAHPRQAEAGGNDQQER
jgi:hypothetical protein